MACDVGESRLSPVSENAKERLRLLLGVTTLGYVLCEGVEAHCPLRFGRLFIYSLVQDIIR